MKNLTLPSTTASLKELKAFTTEFNIEVTGHKGKKASYLEAIEAWQLVKEQERPSEPTKPVQVAKAVKRTWGSYPENIVKDQQEYQKRYRLSADDSDRCSRTPINAFGLSRQRKPRKIVKSLFFREIGRVFA